MKISVIIPAFNEEKYIKRCLIALINQEVKANEIIVIDNNSTDQTTIIAKSLGVNVISEKNQGMIYARNCGFNYASYEIIARCDADVIVSSEWIKKIKNNFKKGSVDALSGPITYIDSPINFKTHLPSHLYLKTLKLFTNGKGFLIGPNMIITKNIWGKVKARVSLDDTKVHEDIDLSLNILRVGGKIGYDKTLVVESSARRMVHKPQSFFFEYPTRMLKTFWINRN